MSNTLTVHFTGICTHVTTGTTVHRVVLVHAEDGANINHAKIPPHVPILRINPDHIVATNGWLYGLQATGRDGEWLLRGAHLTLEGVAEAAYFNDTTYQSEVPHLKQLTPDAPVLSDDIVHNGNAACYFDIPAGHVSASTSVHGAVSTVLRVATTDKPGLLVTSFWNREPRLISLKPGAEIYVDHTGITHGDSDLDFLLHYRVLTSVPADAKVPPATKLRPDRPTDITSGCSNSAYP